MRQLKNNLRDKVHAGALAAAMPALCLIALLLIDLLWHFFSAPPPEQLGQQVVRLFQERGLWIVAIAALGEGLVLFNLYFPGSSVLVLAVAANHADPKRAAGVVAIITIAFVFTTQINYAIGFFGLHQVIRRCGGGAMIATARARYERHGGRILPVFFVHPNLGGFLAVAVGMSRLRWWRFLAVSIPSIAAWNILWGLAAYFSAPVVTETVTSPCLLVIVFTVWAFISFTSGFLRSPTSPARSVHPGLEQ